MKKGIKAAASLHENVPPDWYHRSIKENILQKYWHGRRFEEVESLIEKNPKAKILDIGSADGTFSKVIWDKSKAKQIIGIDVLKTSVKWANNHWKKNKHLKFQLGDAHKLKFKSETFDAVVALEVLEHVYKPIDVLTEVRRVLKKGGYAIFLVPSDSNLFQCVWYLWRKWRGRIWNDTHIQTYRNNYLLTVSKKAGFEIEKEYKFILGMLHVVKVRKVTKR